MADAARVLEEALALTADERARIAHQLIHSVEPEDADAAASWNEELRRGSTRSGPGPPTSRTGKAFESGSMPLAGRDASPLSSGCQC